MTFHELMAGLALAVFWVHMLLVAADAVGCGRRVWRLGARLRAGPLVRARVLQGQGPGQELAEQRVHQRGRSRGDGRIHFHDQHHESEIFGGTVVTDEGRTIELPAVAGEPAQVWPAADGKARAHAPEGSQQLADAHAAAQKARGFARVVRSSIGPGDPVWVLASPALALISATDPRRWVRGRLAAVSGLVVLHLGLSAACTVVAVWPPLFGTVGKLGAFASLVYFMQAQDWTRVLREHTRDPAHAFVGGTWRTE